MAAVDDDAVFEAVRALVESGEYLDAIPGLPGLRPEGGGMFKQTGDGVLRRVYTRGSQAYLEAKRSGVVGPLPPLMPAPATAVEVAEGILGNPLPLLLRRLYLEVANGGFGPGYGVLGLRGGHTDDRKMTAVDLLAYLQAPSSTAWPWLPKGLLPVCHWGCAIYSFVDCSRADGPMWAWDPNPGPNDERALFRQPVTLAEWLRKWVDRRLYQPTLVQDERTGHWRGATDEEIAGWLADLDDDDGR